jgi:hypothetical protein
VLDAVGKIVEEMLSFVVVGYQGCEVLKKDRGLSTFRLQRGRFPKIEDMQH